MELFYLLLLLGLYIIENTIFLIIVCLNTIFWSVSHICSNQSWGSVAVRYSMNKYKEI